MRNDRTANPNKKSRPLINLLLFALIVIYGLFFRPNNEPIPPQPDAVAVAQETTAPGSVLTNPDNLEQLPLTQEEASLPIDGSYDSKEDVALYIHLYGHLPSNYISKKEAEKLGWSGGGLEPYAPGKCIGGSRFGNYEGLLPYGEGRSYTECDIDTMGASSRGVKRIVFSNDGLIYYTADHYKSFTLLYGEP